MFSTAPISHSRIRYPSSSDFSPMMRPAAAYLEKARWGDGFACPHCGTRCRKCRHQPSEGSALGFGGDGAPMGPGRSNPA